MKWLKDGDPSECKRNSFRLTAPLKGGCERDVTTSGLSESTPPDDTDAEGVEEREGSRIEF